MADTLIFRGAYIRSFELRNKEGSREVRIQVTADWTDPVREHMKWDPAPNGYGSSGLIGRLAGSNMIITPNRRELKDHEVDLSVETVDGFELVPVKDNEGEMTGRELRFIVHSTSPEACAWLETYCSKIGRSPSQMKISYVKQEELPLGDDDAEPPLKGEAAEAHRNSQSRAQRGLNAV